MCTCCKDLPDWTHIVGAAALYLRVEVWQRGSSWVRRWAAIIGRKSPLFDASRQIYQENFSLGLQSVLRHEVPGGRDPQILVLPFKRLPHYGEMRSRVLLQTRHLGLAIVRLITLKV